MRVTHPPMMSIGMGLSPIPRKLVNRIQLGEFIDVAELLPDSLGVSTNPQNTGEKDKLPWETKKRQVTSILEWVQCFGIYIAVIAAKHPEKIKDLLGYQALIIEAHMEYDSDTWLGYDRRFRQTAAASPCMVWARIDPTLWNMAFTGQAKAKRRKYCFSLSHLPEDCDWAPVPPSIPAQPNPSMTNLWQKGNCSRTSQICYAWNHSPEPNCVYPGCRYQHICLQCARDPQVANKDHKAMYCGCCHNHQPKPLAGIQQQPGPSSYCYHPYWTS